MIFKDVSHAKYLDRNINSKRLNFFEETIWIYWGKRPIPRNEAKDTYIDMQICSYVLSMLSTITFIYLPFKYFMALFFLGTNGNSIFPIICNVYRAHYSIWFNLMIGLIGLMTHIQFGLEVFGFHLEKYLFWAYLLSGILSVYRRFWNTIIWYKLDSIVIKSRCK